MDTEGGTKILGLHQDLQAGNRKSAEFMTSGFGLSRVAVKELKLSYYIGETLLFTIYTHYGNLI